MDLNKYNIEKLIAWSNARMSRLEKRQAKVTLIVGGIALLLALNSPFESFLLGVTAYSVLQPAFIYMKSARKRFYAKRKLKGVAKELERNGIHTTKLKLQKATTFVTFVEKENYPLKSATAHTTVFKDRNEQLRALRQFRSEVLTGTCTYCTCISNCLKETKCKSVDRQETEIIKDQEKVKQLLLEMKEG